MFEQSTIRSGPAGKRLWTTALGVAGEAVLVGFAILAPMVWPQVLPHALLSTTIFTPGAPPGRPAPPPAVIKAARPPGTATSPKLYQPTAFVEPVSYPRSAAILIDEPPAGVFGSPNSGPETSSGRGNWISDGLGNDAAAIPPPPPRPPATPPTTTVKPPAKIIRVSSLQMAHLVHRVEPPYPPLAKAMRVQGTVELSGIIGTDGRIRELRVVSGHPLLAKAALEAVSQWLFEPTLLSGEPVEVSAPITVTFRLKDQF